MDKETVHRDVDIGDLIIELLKEHGGEIESAGFYGLIEERGGDSKEAHDWIASHDWVVVSWNKIVLREDKIKDEEQGERKISKLGKAGSAGASSGQSSQPGSTPKTRPENPEPEPEPPTQKPAEAEPEAEAEAEKGERVNLQERLEFVWSIAHQMEEKSEEDTIEGERLVRVLVNMYGLDEDEAKKLIEVLDREDRLFKPRVGWYKTTGGG